MRWRTDYESCYHRIAKFSIEEVHAMWECQHDLGKTGRIFHNGVAEEKKVYFKMCGVRFHVRSDRYDNLFMNGTKCKRCGLEGRYFWLESNSRDKNGEWKNFHFNLYGIDKHGNEVQLTKDHIVPKSKGGKDCICNYQTLCRVCNEKKADSMSL